MYLQSRLSVLPADRERYAVNGRGREGLQDADIPAQEETSRGAVSGRRDYGNITLDHCFDAVQDVKYITLRQLRSPRRVYTMQRHLFVALACEWTSESYPRIGQYIDKHHSTVMYYEQRQKTEDFYALYEKAEDRIQKELARQERKSRAVR